MNLSFVIRPHLTSLPEVHGAMFFVHHWDDDGVSRLIFPLPALSETPVLSVPLPNTAYVSIDRYLLYINNVHITLTLCMCRDIYIFSIHVNSLTSVIFDCSCKLFCNTNIVFVSLDKFPLPWMDGVVESDQTKIVIRRQVCKDMN